MGKRGQDVEEAVYWPCDLTHEFITTIWEGAIENLESRTVMYTNGVQEERHYNTSRWGGGEVSISRFLSPFSIYDLRGCVSTVRGLNLKGKPKRKTFCFEDWANENVSEIIESHVYARRID